MRICLAAAPSCHDTFAPAAHGRARPASGDETDDARRGPAHRRQHRQAAGAAARWRLMRLSGRDTRYRERSSDRRQDCSFLIPPVLARVF